MEIIKRGAEAVLYKDVFDGSEILVKERIKKKYRIEELDSRIRKSRTREEVKLMREARACGVPTPQVVRIDEKENKIFMEFVGGETVKNFLSGASKAEARKIFDEIGSLVGKLHSNGIIHGDLTTSNMILKDGKIFFIDFGLGMFSRRAEDKATDLHLLYEVLNSTHYKILEICWKSFLNGYRKEYEKAGEIIKQMEEIEKRARYVEGRQKI